MSRSKNLYSGTSCPPSSDGSDRSRRSYTSDFSTDYTKRVTVPSYVAGMQNSCYYSFCCNETGGIPFGYNPQKNVNTNVKLMIDDNPYSAVEYPWYKPFKCEPLPAYDNRGGPND